MIRALVISLALATPGLAQERPAPDYFIEGLFATKAAQELAKGCPDVAFDRAAISLRSAEIAAQLAADGIDPQNPLAHVAIPFDRLEGMQEAFMAKYEGRGFVDFDLCSAGRQEIVEGTGIGRLLVEVRR